MRYDGRRFGGVTRTRYGLEINGMAANRDTRYLRGLLQELRSSHEAEWVEFKVNNEKPALIGKYVSALANAAALAGKAHGYVAWGIEDETRALVGTSFSPRTARKGNEALETWLSRLLEPQVAFRFHELAMDGKRFVLLEVDGAAHRPVAFQGTEFIRVGSAKRKLKDFPEKERALWGTFSRIRFEEGVAAERLGGEDVLLELDYPAYFDLLGQPVADGRDATLEALERDGLIVPCDAGGFNVTNLGATLLASGQLSASAAQGAAHHRIPRQRPPRDAARTRGDEGICRRLRRVDGLPRCAVADARGERARVSAIHAGVSAAGCTRAVLFGRKPLAAMDRPERVRACYLHACLKHVNREFLTNASLRKRFDINAATSASAASMASRYIREAVEAGYIKPLDEQAGRRRMSYAPFWAASDQRKFI